MKVFSIWISGDGFVLVAGELPPGTPPGERPPPGWLLVKRFEAAGWDGAIATLHEIHERKP